MQKVAVLIFIAFYFTGCSKSGGGSTPASQCTKPIQSLWTEETGLAQIDISDVPFDVLTPYELIISNNGSCVMDVFLSGENCSGTINTINSVYVGTDVDPGCADLVGLENYTIEGAKMTVCDYNDETDCGFYE
jgi:hypothetical protein